MLSLELFWGVGNTPTHLYFQPAWIGKVLDMEVNKLPFRWPMHEGNTGGTCLWSWLKAIYESTAKLDPLRRFYGENIRSLKLKAGG